MSYKPLPIGVDIFEKIIKEGYYYVDKTLFIKELIDLKGDVNLFTRPRRFGKSLNISMLQYFFEDTGDEEKNNRHKKLFDGLKIINMGEKYTFHMCKYPVINISLKSAKMDNFKMSYSAMKNSIVSEYSRHEQLINSTKLSKGQIDILRKILDTLDIDDDKLPYSLKFLSECLYKHFGEKTIILIDEYDVPLETAYHNGFYKQTVNFIRSFFEQALKTNKSLNFAVLTGCLRISKESIFTGLNNFEAVSIMNKAYSEHYGFTDLEIDEMLKYFGFEDKKETVKGWYNGYMFGNTEVYNPWSIINYVKSIYVFRDEFPKPYWSNTSSNDIIKTLIERDTSEIKDDVENLINSGNIEFQVHEEITYSDVESNDENIWNFLFFTGYLKKISERFIEEEIYIKVKIPNSELKYIYKNIIIKWFDKSIKQKDMTDLYRAVFEGDEKTFSEIVSDELMNMISYNDYQESFYHGIIIGIFSKMKNYTVVSNLESGLGRPDILIRPRTVRKEAIILELKKVDNIDDLEATCIEALKQIEIKKYEEDLRRDGFRKFIKYGVAFCKKECLVKRNT